MPIKKLKHEFWVSPTTFIFVSTDLSFVLLQPASRSPSSHHTSTSWELCFLVGTKFSSFLLFQSISISLCQPPIHTNIFYQDPSSDCSGLELQRTIKDPTATTLVQNPETSNSHTKLDYPPNKRKYEIVTSRDTANILTLDAQTPVQKPKCEEPRQYPSTRSYLLQQVVRRTI